MLMRLGMTVCVLALCAQAAADDARYNPFASAERVAPPVRSGGGPSVVTHLRLKAVIPLGNPPMANIDGTVLAVGEKISGYTLRSVGESMVTLERGGRRYTLSFPKPGQEKGEGAS
ncbi:MAG: hypothetical protein R3E84_04165 [Pseudomonadales bacterium]